jgi:hypothetical protein
MNSYQKKLFKKFEKFRQQPKWPIYPPYHKGDYLEEYFIKYFEQNNINTKKIFIPVAWSSCYINNNDVPLCDFQQELNSLEKDEEYFIVSTHDDAPREILPKNTTCFSAGGNKGDIPIPLIVSKLPFNTGKEKKHFCSFVGSLTHPIRKNIFHKYSKNSNFLFFSKNWSPNVNLSELENFINITSESYFGLAPRGYGKTSYRLYEIMQLSSIPVYCSDVFWLPWKNEIDWSSICVLSNDIDILDLQLKEFLYLNDYNQIIKNINIIYDNYFTIESTTKKIVEMVNK